MLRKISLLMLILAACGEDSSAPSDQEDEDKEGEQVRDASARDARTNSGRDAGRTEDEEEEEDAGATTARDAGGRNDASTGRSDASTADAGSATGDCDALTYDEFAKSFFTTYCISCHGKMDPTFNDLSEIEPHLDTIKERVVEPADPSEQMPPKGVKQPTAAEKQKLAQWIECGGE